MNKSFKSIRDERESLLAWFEPSKGPEDIIGVRLVFIDPIDKFYERALEEANKDKDTSRALSLLHSKQYYEGKGQKFFTPDVGWWMSKEDYTEGKEGFGGVTREQMELKYRNITIFETCEEAIAAAKSAGLI